MSLGMITPDNLNILIKNKNDIVVRNVFILIFTRSGRLFGRLVYNNKITIKGEI